MGDKTERDVSQLPASSAGSRETSTGNEAYRDEGMAVSRQRAGIPLIAPPGPPEGLGPLPALQARDPVLAELMATVST